jgi:hypothetical protein
VIVAKPGEQFYTDAVGQRAHPSQIKPPVKLHLSMAASWLSLARQDEAIDNLLATSWNLVPDPQTCVSGNGYKQALRRNGRSA